MSDRNRRDADRVPERRGVGPAQPGYRLDPRLEVRAIDGGEDGAAEARGVQGYTAMFNSLSEPLGFFETFREKIAPGAFEKTVAENDIRCLFNHESSRVLGRSRPEFEGSTLVLREDDVGLWFEVGELPDTTDGRDLPVLLDRGDVDGCSFGFRVVRDEWDYDPDPDEADGVDVIRTLLEIELFDVGPVTFPAYPETSAEARATAKGMHRARTIHPHAAIRRHRLAELDH